MGLRNSVQKSGLKYIEKYYKAISEGKTITEAHIKQIYNCYDTRQRGFLFELEAMMFLEDLAYAAGLVTLIKEKDKEFGKLEKNKEKQKAYLDEYLRVLWHEIDPEVANKLPKEKFEQVLQKDWREFLSGTISGGRDTRQFTLRLRETVSNKKKDKSEENSLRQCNVKSEDDESLSDSEEVKETDAIWEEKLHEEKKQQEEEERATASIALSTENLNDLRKSQVLEVSNILQVREQVAQKLLAYSKWDLDSLLNDYFANTEDYLQRAGVEPKNKPASSNTDTGSDKTQDGSDKLQTTSDSSSDILCKICFDNYPENQMTKMDACGHHYCNACWKDNLEFQISDGHTFDIHCMSHGCLELVPASIVESIVTGEMLEKYKRFLQKSFVDTHGHIKWCPAPGCQYALTEATTECGILVATCHCGYRMCWECGKSAHVPATCKMVEVWLSLATSEKETLGFLVTSGVDNATLKWMQSHTKECPFCGVSVQKNDGCYCMTCSNCSRQWCWMCREDFSTHTKGHFKCTKYNTGEFALRNTPQHQDGSLYKQRQRLQRLARFYKHYETQSATISSENTADALKIDQCVMDELTRELCSLDVSFVPQARAEIKKCREILQYSYVVLFFTVGKKKLKMVEYMQENLLISINKLLDVLQQNISYHTAKSSIVSTSTTTTSPPVPPQSRGAFNSSKRQQSGSAQISVVPSPPTGPLDPPTVRKHIKILHGACDALMSVISSVETSVH